MTAGDHLSLETFDLLAMQALPGAQAQQAQAHLGACSGCHARYEELVRDRQRFSQYVLPRTAEAVRERALGKQRLSFWLQLAGAASAVAVIAGVLAIVLRQPEPLPGSGDEAPGVYVAARGAARFEVFVKRGDAVFALEPGARVQPGDALRFRAAGASASAKHLLVLSRDGKGSTSVYHPFGGRQSAELSAGLVELPGSVVLDDVLGRETLWAIFSSAPLEAAQVQPALGQEGALRGLDGVQDVVSLDFDKVAP